MTLYSQHSGGEEAELRDMFGNYSRGNHHPFALSPAAIFRSQYPGNWQAELTRAYLHGIPTSESLMHNLPQIAAPRADALVPSRPDYSQPGHTMERPSFSQKLRRLRSLQIPDGRLLPSSREQPASQSTISQASSSITTFGLPYLDGSSPAAVCSGDLADGMSFQSNATWTSPAMTIADSVSPASSFQVKQGASPTPDCQSAFSVSSPLTAQEIQQPVWSMYGPTFACDGQTAYAADIAPGNSFGTSYQNFPTTLQAMNIGLPVAQTDMSSTSSWPAGNERNSAWPCSTFQAPAAMCWHQEVQPADSGFMCNTMPQAEFVTPTQLVSYSPPDASPSPVQSSPSIQAQSTLVASATPPEHNDPVQNGSKPVRSAAAERRRKDAVLLKLRAQGVPYAEIKRLTGRTEAESTLRGQVRVLSRPAHQRVRKPVWKRSDISLLGDIIREHHDNLGSSPAPERQKPRGGRPVQPPWKQVAEDMSKGGGSYPFSPSACSKKWREVAGSLHRAGRR